MNLPAAFEEKMKQLLKEEYSDYINCYEEPRYYGLRVNTNKISVEAFERICPFRLWPVPWIKNGFYYDGETESPGKHPYYFAGLYYLQEPSAMTPADRLPVFPGDKVLDLCAAPGGKATELGARLLGKGLLAANDISNSRAKGLLKNLEVFGIGNVLVFSEEPGKLLGYFPEYFDKILIDAPCSGEGMFRKDKKMVKAWEAHGPEYFSKIQQRILLQAADMLKPGGLLLYSTCTFDALENEQSIAYLLSERPEFSIQQMVPYEGFESGRPELLDETYPELKRTVRIFPHKMHGEGHYLALLQKGKSKEADCERLPSFSKPVPKKVPKELAAFFEDVDKELCLERLEIHGERVYEMPEGTGDMKGIRFLRTGLLLGELKKQRFEPSQAFAMHLKKEQYRHTIDLPVSDERVRKYLKGETIEIDSRLLNGWYLFCTDGYPLGWGKAINGMLKNKYLPGWRCQS